jgi:hypothetical protein
MTGRIRSTWWRIRVWLAFQLPAAPDHCRICGCCDTHPCSRDCRWLDAGECEACWRARKRETDWRTT